MAMAGSGDARAVMASHVPAAMTSSISSVTMPRR